MRRWLHNKLKAHRWEVVSHRHGVEHNGETFDCYRLAECRCGVIREAAIRKVEIESPFPGLAFGFVQVYRKQLDSLEEAMLWERP